MANPDLDTPADPQAFGFAYALTVLDDSAVQRALDTLPAELSAEIQAGLVLRNKHGDSDLASVPYQEQEVVYRAAGIVLQHIILPEQVAALEEATQVATAWLKMLKRQGKRRR